MGRKRKLPLDQETISECRESIARLAYQISGQQVSNRRRRNLEREIQDAIDDLSDLLEDLDPIQQPKSVFDPGNPKVVGRFIALALVAQPRQSLANIERFYGSGIYAIYYNGDFPVYASLSGSETPVYVGQAGPSVSNARTPKEQGDRLWRRLQDHRKNIGKAVTSLHIEDFERRSLVVQSGWESAAEDYLIHLFRPIWNNETSILYGIGKHGDAAETRANRRSPWDSLHPGRAWADNEVLVDAKSIQEIELELATHFELHPVFESLGSVLDSFINELRQI